MRPAKRFGIDAPLTVMGTAHQSHSSPPPRGVCGVRGVVRGVRVCSGLGNMTPRERSTITIATNRR